MSPPCETGRRATTREWKANPVALRRTVSVQFYLPLSVARVDWRRIRHRHGRSLLACSRTVRTP